MSARGKWNDLRPAARSAVAVLFWSQVAGVLLLLVGSIAAATADEKFPARWRKSMVNDPEVNFALKKYSNMPDDQIAAALKKGILLFLVGNLCEGAQINRPQAKAFIDGSGIFPPDDDKRRKEEQVMGDFLGFEYEDLAHLCGGVAYMFGPNGVLIAGAVTPGNGEPKIPYDEKNPYLRIVPLYRERQ